MTPLLNALTDREEAVLMLIADGYGLGEIGLRLGIAEGTARIHKENALRKMGAANQAHGVAMLLRARTGMVVG